MEETRREATNDYEMEDAVGQFSHDGSVNRKRETGGKPGTEHVLDEGDVSS